MAWQDIFAGSQPGLSDEDRNSLARGGLLQAGLSALSANSQPGVTPIQALSGGLLGGIQSAQQGGQQLVQDRYKQQQMQFQQSQMQDQQDQQARRRQIQDLALKHVTQGPDGKPVFDQAGYTQELAGIDPEAALELHKNELQTQAQQLAIQKGQRDLSVAPTREIDMGNSKVTQELQPDGTWKQLASAARFAPQQQSETARQIAEFRKLGATDDQIKAKFGLTPGDGDTALTPDAIENMAWDQALTGNRPQYSRGKSGDAIRNQVNNKVAEIAKTAGMSPQELSTVAGRNKALQGSLAYTQKSADALDRQAETFEANFGTMMQLGQKVSRSGIPAFNKMILNAKLNYQGDPDTAAFLTARNLAAQEYAKIAMQATGAGGTTDSAREHALEAINSAQTPEQLEAVHKALQQDVANQKQATINKLNDLTSRKVQFGSTVPQMSAGSALPAANAPPAAPAQGPKVFKFNPSTGQLEAQ